MPPAIDALERPAVRPAPLLDSGSTGGGGLGGGGDGPWYGPDGERRLPKRAYFTGIFVALAPIVMLFAAFGSSYIVRQGLSDDWRALALPPVLWFSTALLALSSLALEGARRALKAGRLDAFKRRWSAATLLGLGFMAGQGLAWWQLQAQGIYLESNPSSSFFYLLTATHALHLLGGVAALLWVLARCPKAGTEARPTELRVEAGRSVGVDVSAIYWHFMDGVWLFVFGLFLIGR